MSQQFPSELIQLLRKAERVTVLTGAGILSESSLPAYRDPQDGLWSRFRPQDLANAAAFRKDPGLVWGWYAWRRRAAMAAEPNAGHVALARMETLVPKFVLITQNIDGLHARAGSGNLLELHGSLLRSKCLEENIVMEPAEGDEESPPRCTRCGAMLRPDVVWFGEGLPDRALDAALEATAACQVFFAVGTSATVNPAAELPGLAMQGGAMVVEINPEPTGLSGQVHLSLRGQPAVILSRLVMATWPGGV